MLKKSILKKFNQSIRAAEKSKFYEKKLAGLRVNTVEDIAKIPLTTKLELREQAPFGTLAVPLNKVIEVHTSSGTTGKSIPSFFTKKDIDNTKKYISKAWAAFGITNRDVVQFMMQYGLFSGAFLNHYALTHLGAFVVPAGISNSMKQIQLMQEFQTTTIVAVPSYYFRLKEVFEQENIKLEDLSLKRGIAAGETYSNSTRKKIENMFNIDVYDHYGLAEINTGICYECKYKEGMHVLDDYVYAEIVNPKTGEVLGENEEGELVLTTLEKEANPIIRYKTGDITSITYEKCKCGRTQPRIEMIKGRVDNTIQLHGVKIYPIEIELLLNSFKSLTGDYRFYYNIEKYGEKPKMIIQQEKNKANLFNKEKDHILNKLDCLMNLKVECSFVEELPFEDKTEKIKKVFL